MMDALESLVVFHCVPVLAGIKPANTFTWHPSAKYVHACGISHLENILTVRGVRVECLCRCDRDALIMLYRMLNDPPKLCSFQRNWEAQCRELGAVLACDSVTCSNQPGEDTLGVCMNLGAALA